MSNQPQEFTLPVARQILLTSFWLSQGSTGLQEMLFGSIHLFQPTWRLTDEMLRQLEALAPAIIALMARGGHVPQREGEVRKELQKQIRNLATELGFAPVEEDPETRQEVLAYLLRHFIQRDHHFLCEEGLRIRAVGGETTETHPHHDAYLSFYCYYVLLGHDCGCEVFDRLLEALRQVCAGHAPDARRILHLALTDEPALREHLAEVIATYLQHHPTVPLVLSACLAPFAPDGEEEASDV